MRIHRLISILLLIESRDIIKAKELAAKLEISERTVYRDIEALCEAGIPIATSTGPNGGIRLMDGYSCGIDHLREDDIINLYLSGMGIQPDRQSGMAMKLNNTLLKLQKSLSSNQSDEINSIKKRFYFDDTPWWGQGSRLDHIDTLMRSVFQSKVLQIVYQKHEGELSRRKVYPYGLVVKRLDWYLIAYCEKNNEIRTFKCERIVESEILDEMFSVPGDFNIEEYWKKSRKEFVDRCAEEEYYPVSIRLHKSRAEVLSDLEVLGAVEEGGYILATVNMFGYECAAADMTKIIGYAEVISPAELRTFVKDELNRLSEVYHADIIPKGRV